MTSANEKCFLGMCSTRWSERDVSYKHFYRAIQHMVETFKVMNGNHPELRNFKRFMQTGGRLYF